MDTGGDILAQGRWFCCRCGAESPYGLCEVCACDAAEIEASDPLRGVLKPHLYLKRITDVETGDYL